ncbi:MAG: response regulator [Candidatus Competibacter sp.]|nr:response regulator [Candidatus Competibacter sp.]MDG4583312.1 response regulator [Candidatus Competibacter sp.]
MPVRHVLVVDDSKSARLMLRKMLQGFGMTVDTVESAEEALSYLRAQRPDAIFMDYTMPGMDGLMAVRQIKSSPATASIPVAMYTSKDEPSYQDEARAAGAIGVLSKPAMPETLGAILEELSALFDAANIASPGSPEPVAPPTAAGMTVDGVGAIALEKAEQVFYEAIETQVLPLINDVVAKLRRDLETSQQETCGQIATRVCAERLAAWQPPEPHETQPSEATLRAWILPLMEQRLETHRREARTDLEKLVREVAGQICQDQMHELSGRLVRQLSLRFVDATQKAGDDAREAAVKVAREVASQAAAAAKSAAESTVGQADAATVANAAAAAEQTARLLWADAQRDLRRSVRLAAGCAAAAGIGAAVLVYVLR